MTWSTLANQKENSGDLLNEAAFNSTIEKGTATKGSWKQDYEWACKENNITPCPFIMSHFFSGDNEKEVCRIANVNVDLSSWRAMLIACATQDSKVIEVDVHFCEITAQHLKDLAKALEQLGTCRILRIHYLQNMDMKATEVQDALKLVFSDVLNLEYISFMGNDIGDDTLTSCITPVLANNYRLKSLNLSKNSLTDSSVHGMFLALRHRTNIVNISVQNNNLTGSFLATSVGPVISGQYTAAPEDEGTIKEITKTIGDKNKVIKGVNGKRKKAGYSELSELTAPAACIAKNKDGKSVVLNRAIRCIDMSWNKEVTMTNIEKFLEGLAEPVEIADSEAAIEKLVMVTKGALDTWMKDLTNDVVNDFHKGSALVRWEFANK